MTDCFVATFYRFASLDDHVVLRDRIEAVQDLGIRGIILLATEGINATVSQEPENRCSNCLTF